MATRKPAVKLKNSNKLFKEFLSKNNADLRDGYLKIMASEKVLAARGSFKTVLVDVRRVADGMDAMKEKSWQQSMVYQLKKIGFVCRRVAGSVDVVYEMVYFCKTIV